MVDRLITLAELSKNLGGLSRASVYRFVRTLPGFPQIVKIGAATRFRESEVQAFISKSEVKRAEVGP